MRKELMKSFLKAYSSDHPQDAVKMIYQSCYGCGHMINDLEETTKKIREELSECPANTQQHPYDLIGNGLCRYYLTGNVPPDVLAKAMKISAAVKLPITKSGTEILEKEVALLKELAGDQELDFSEEALDAYLSEYRNAGYPLISHTKQYRDTYHPAYRVILSDIALLMEIILFAEQRLKNEKTAVVVFDGPCGSGKSTLAHLLADFYNTQTIPMDDYFLLPEMRTPERLATPGGNVHVERFIQEIAETLLRHTTINRNRFDCQSGNMITVEYIPGQVTVVEGSYSHHPILKPYWQQLGALCVYVDINEIEQLERIKKRNPERLTDFIDKWIPLEKRYFEEYDIKYTADMIIQSIPHDPLTLH